MRGRIHAFGTRSLALSLVGLLGKRLFIRVRLRNICAKSLEAIVALVTLFASGGVHWIRLRHGENDGAPMRHVWKS